jgi:hypothetical protein
MEPRNLNRPSYVLALLLGFVAIVDAVNALLGMQSSELCSGASSTCGNPGWFIDLMTSGVSAALLALLLMRPHIYVFTAVVAWSLIAFLANFVMRHSPGIDTVATARMAVYFVTLIVAGVLFVIEGRKWLDAERAKRPVVLAAPVVPVWTGTGWSVAYAAPPAAPYAAPVSPQPPFGSPWMPPAAPTAPYASPLAPQPPFVPAPPFAPPAPPVPPAPEAAPAPPEAVPAVDVAPADTETALPTDAGDSSLGK